jgi:multiple sugar transport system ATP-binding protein
MTRDVTLGIRPESWRTAAQDEPGLRVKVSVVEELGADAFVYGAAKIDGVRDDLIVRIPGRVIPGRG